MYSGILAAGSRAALVSRFAAASTKQNGMKIKIALGTVASDGLHTSGLTGLSTNRMGVRKRDTVEITHYDFGMSFCGS